MKSDIYESHLREQLDGCMTCGFSGAAHGYIKHKSKANKIVGGGI